MSILEKFGVTPKDFARLNEEELRHGMVGWMHVVLFSSQSGRIQNLLCEVYEFLFPPEKAPRHKFLGLPIEQRQVIANYITKIKKDYGLL